MDKQQDHNSTISSGNVLNSASYQSARVGFGALVQKHFDHPMVTAVGCYMKRGQVVQGDVIDLSVALQQLPDTIHVVPLGRHVDGGQAVLGGRGHRELARANIIELRRPGRGCTLVLAWIGAPCSSRISMMRTCPFRAAQWSGVNSSCEDKTMEAESARDQDATGSGATFVLASIWAPLSSRSRTIITFPLLEAI